MINFIKKFFKAAFKKKSDDILSSFFKTLDKLKQLNKEIEEENKKEQERLEKIKCCIEENEKVRCHNDKVVRRFQSLLDVEEQTFSGESSSTDSTNITE